VTGLHRGRARIVRASELGSAKPLAESAPSETPGQRARRIPHEELQARERAERTIEEAKARASEILQCAEREAKEIRDRAQREAAAQQEATLAARWLELTKSQSAALARESDRVTAVAVALAERLLGSALAMDPSRIVDLARTVLDEARGSRRVILHAHPVDAEALRVQLLGAGFEPCSAEVREDPALARGDLRLQTELGNIDAQLAPRLERLASALRSSSSQR
jgi:flagellar biosynthesis/type III secretory pathway protein FliH